MVKNKEILESKVETHLKDVVKRIGGLAYKFKSTVIGVPDQIILYGGHTYFVEVKRPGEKPRPSQVKVHEEMAQRGVTVYTVDTLHSVDTFIESVIGVKIPPKTKRPVNESISPLIVKEMTK